MINDQALTSSKTLSYPACTLLTRPILQRFGMVARKWIVGVLTFFVGRHGDNSKSYDDDDHFERWLTDDELEQGQIYFGESFTLVSSTTSRIPTVNALVPGTTLLPDDW